VSVGHDVKHVALQVGAGEGGKYRVVLDSDEGRFGGRSRLGHGVDHFTQPEGVPGTLAIVPTSKSGITMTLWQMVFDNSCVDPRAQMGARSDRHVLRLLASRGHALNSLPRHLRLLCRTCCRAARDELQQSAALHASAGPSADCGRLCSRARGLGVSVVRIVRGQARLVQASCTVCCTGSVCNDAMKQAKLNQDLVSVGLAFQTGLLSLRPVCSTRHLVGRLIPQERWTALQQHAGALATKMCPPS
jgi:Alpha amylase, C-terminal all-beta domain